MRAPIRGPVKHLVRHLPLLAALIIAVCVSAEWKILAPLRSEAFFGWAVLVLMPAAVLLVLLQVAIWVALAGRAGSDGERE